MAGGVLSKQQAQKQPQVHSWADCRVHTLLLHIAAVLLQSLIMENTHNFPVEYEWVLSSQSPVFAVTPTSGTIKPKTSSSVVVRWTPGQAPPVPVPKAKAGPADKAADAAATIARPSSIKRNSSKIDGKVATANAKAAASTDASKPAAAANANTAVTVELAGTAGPDAAAVADAAALGCQQTGFMTLKLKGGADVAPKKVMLLGELPAG